MNRSVMQFAVANRFRLGFQGTGFYTLHDAKGRQVDISYYPTAASGKRMMERHLKENRMDARVPLPDTVLRAAKQALEIVDKWCDNHDGYIGGWTNYPDKPERSPRGYVVEALDKINEVLDSEDRTTPP